MSELYTQAKVTNSTCAKYIDWNQNKFGIITLFVRVSCRRVRQCRADHYAIMKTCRPQIAYPNTCILRGPGLKYIHELEILPNEFTIVDVTFSTSLCFLIQVNNTNFSYAVEPVNMVEQE